MILALNERMCCNYFVIASPQKVGRIAGVSTKMATAKISVLSNCKPSPYWTQM